MIHGYPCEPESEKKHLRKLVGSTEIFRVFRLTCEKKLVLTKSTVNQLEWFDVTIAISQSEIFFRQNGAFSSSQSCPEPPTPRPIPPSDTRTPGANKKKGRKWKVGRLVRWNLKHVKTQSYQNYRIICIKLYKYSILHICIYIYITMYI